MQELFTAEIEAERNRLDAGTRMAGTMLDDEPELDLEGDWLDDEVGSAHTMQTQPPSRSLWVLIIVLVALLAAWTIFLLIGQSGSSDSGASNFLQVEEIRPILATAQPMSLK